MTAQPTHLIQILLPKNTGSGQPVPQQWFNDLLKELTDRFGGATSFVRAPGEGRWKSRGETERDSIAVVEVMAKDLDLAFWHALRKRLERDLSQDEIVIRAQEMVLL